jgi:hypothetical protein
VCPQRVVPWPPHCRAPLHALPRVRGTAVSSWDVRYATPGQQGVHHVVPGSSPCCNSVPTILWNPMVHYRVHKRPPLLCFQSHFSRIHFTVSRNYKGGHAVA